jgi:hypothetical protein
MRQGTGRTPYHAESLLMGTAASGGANTQDCNPGGDGYAVITFAP